MEAGVAQAGSHAQASRVSNRRNERIGGSLADAPVVVHALALAAVSAKTSLR